MIIVFLMDSFETLSPKKDSSLALMKAAQRRGHQVFYCGKNGLSLNNGSVLFYGRRCDPRNNFTFGAFESIGAYDIGAVFIRTDPPFDTAYLMHTWILDHLPNHVNLINTPHGLRTVNEKIWCSRFLNLTPRTLVTYHKSEFKTFLNLEKKIIVKPANSFGGNGVFSISLGDTNAQVVFELLSGNGNTAVICQEFLEAATHGDKRILLLGGKPLGALLRVHGSDDHRNNFFSGGYPEACGITEKEYKIIDQLEPYLKDLGLHFVGIDTIGEKLIEVNVTSPTCLLEMNSLYNLQLEDKVIKYMENIA